MEKALSDGRRLPRGGKDWEAGAYSPLTNAIYMPLRNICGRQMSVSLEENSFLALTQREELAPGTDQLGTVQAVSVETGETLWRYDQRAGTTSLAAIGGGLIFGGDANGRFRAHDHETGAVLWEINIGSPVTGFPVTYAVDGRQYVAVSTGNTGTTSAQIRLTRELRPSAGNNLFVFALNGFTSRGSGAISASARTRPSRCRRLGSGRTTTA